MRGQKKVRKSGAEKWSKYPVKSVIFEFLWTKLVFFGRTRPETVSKPVFFKIQFFTKKKTYRKKKCIRICFFFRQIFNYESFLVFRDFSKDCGALGLIFVKFVSFSDRKCHKMNKLRQERLQKIGHLLQLRWKMFNGTPLVSELVFLFCGVLENFVWFCDKNNIFFTITR